MLTTTTPQAIIDDVLALTDDDGYSLEANAQLVAWINEELVSMWQWATRCNRDAFTSYKEGSIASGNTISMTAAAPTGLAITDFGSIRGVDLKVGTDQYTKIDPWNFATRDRLSTVTYRAIADTLWILPAQYATTYPLRVWYVTNAPVASVSALSTAMTIPQGGAEYIKQGVAAKVRVRGEDDPSPHLAWQAQARANIESWLKAAHGDQSVIADVSDDWDY